MEQAKEVQSDNLIQTLHMDDLSGGQPRQIDTSTPGGAEARLKSPETREQSFHVIDASSSGEIQFRLPSRDVGRMDRERRERPGADGPRAGSLNFAVEDPKVHNSRGIMRSTNQGERSPTHPMRSHVIFDGNNYNQGYGRSRGLPRYDSPIRGEPIREGDRQRRARPFPCPLFPDPGQGRDWRGFPPNIMVEPNVQCRESEGMHRERGYGRSGPSLWDVREEEDIHRRRGHQFSERSQPTQRIMGGQGYRERKNRKPATYDGTSNWSDYLVQFEIVADLNQWDDEERALELATSLRGDAQGVLGDLSPENRRDFYHLVHALNNRFQPDNQAELYRAQIKNRLRKRSEPLSELAHDVKRLIRLAYPTAPLEVREHLARDCFIDSLNNSDMEWAVFQGKPATTDQAMKLALEYEAFLTGRKRRLDGKADVRMQCEYPEDSSDENELNVLSRRVAKLETEATPRQYMKREPPSRVNGNCFYCQESGHYIAKCPRRLQDMRDSVQQPNRYSVRSHQNGREAQQSN